MTDKTINTIINGNGPCNSYLSVVPYNDNKSVELVIGANYSNACAMRFSKLDVLELAELLVELAKRMES